MSARVAPSAQRGAAILLAMLIMAVLATLASAAIATHWSQQRAGALAQQTLQHESLLLAGQQWAHAILIDDGLHTKTDNLSEAWAQPMPPTPLSAFLGLERAPSTIDAAVSIRIEDLSGKWNILSLRRASDQSQHISLARKIAADAGLEPDRFIRLVDAAPPERSDNWFGGSSALRSPQSPEACLRWLGFTPEEIARTRPMLTCLPGETALNINTVSPKFFEWLLDPEVAELAIKERAKRPFNSLADAAVRLKVPESTFPFVVFGHPSIGWTVSTPWFAVRTEVVLDGVAWQTTQTVQRLGSFIQTLSTVQEP